MKSLLACAFAFAAAVALAAPADSSYSLESRAAIGAHHLCSGLWVVGRVTPRARKTSSRRTSSLQGFQLGFPLHFRGRFDAAHGDGERPGIVPRSCTSTTAIRAARSCRAVKRQSISRRSPCRGTRRIGDPPWPTGDKDAAGHVPDGVTPRVDAALDWGMAQTQHNTRAIVVVHGGKIVGERYAPGWTADTPQISWSARQEHHGGARRHSRPPRGS